MGQKIIIICGPTAAGKTRAGIWFARRFQGEIVAADSQQVWRGFDIGTAKTSPAERSEIPHHVIDVAEPAERFDAARFVALADAAIADIAARGRVPFVVGGTGMYLRMLVRGLCAAPPRDPGVRMELEKEAAREGVGALHARLALVDPETAARVAPSDRSRVIRALEIHRLSDVPASQLRDRHGFQELRYDVLKIGLDLSRGELYRRIDERVETMIAAGLVEEVRGLVARHPAACQPFAAVGYREISAHLRGELSLEEAIHLVKRNSRRLAKRQLTWFRADPEIRWCGAERFEEMAGMVEGFLTRTAKIDQFH